MQSPTHATAPRTLEQRLAFDSGLPLGVHLVHLTSPAHPGKVVSVVCGLTFELTCGCRPSS